MEHMMAEMVKIKRESVDARMEKGIGQNQNEYHKECCRDSKCFKQHFFIVCLMENREQFVYLYTHRVFIYLKNDVRDDSMKRQKRERKINNEKKVEENEKGE